VLDPWSMPLLRPARRLALLYHAIDPHWPSSLSVSPDVFASQMQRLHARGYRGVTLSAAADGSLDGPVVAVTFDDAYTSVEERALPVLEELGWVATVFAPTESVSTGRPMEWLGADRERYPDATSPLSWDALGRLAERGWEVGSHSRTHRRLSALDDDELHEELAGSRRELSAHFGRCDGVSYPFGEIDARVLEAARRAGYTLGSGNAARFVHGEPLRIPRLAIGGNDAGLRAGIKMSASLWLVRSTPLWTALDYFRG
jgi:peptidoglycan/xylan/chitin deacetylase (PgdA/CDA1 family)